MANEGTPNTISDSPNTPEAIDDSTESFGSLLSQFEKTHADRSKTEAAQKEGIVVSISSDSVFLDIGFKVEGVLSRGAFENNAEGITIGDRFPVSVKGRNEEGYYALSRLKIAQPTDWSSLEEAFAQKTAVVGTATGVVKGGLTVDLGVRAFMPASRSGTRDAAELEKLVGQEITCRIVKLDAADEDVVVDRRVILEEQTRQLEQKRYSEVSEGDIVSGQVRSLTSYGAFVDLGGVDGLLHVSDIAWSRVNNPEEVLTVGQQLQVKILKVDADNRRISIGLKQLQPEPWDSAADKYQLGQRVSGTVKRLTDFGAFIEVEPGIEGLIHVSEMSWVNKVRKPGDLLKLEDTVEAVILSINPAERRLSLGLKQALGDPWAVVPQKFPAGSVIEGPVARLTKFGAFVQLAEGIEGLVHISEISAEKRINHPQDVLKTGQIVKAQVLAIDIEKRQIKLSMKQLIPTDLDEYLEEHSVGDVVSGRLIEQTADNVIVELGEGIRAHCAVKVKTESAASSQSEAKLDLSALSSMLNARWKGETKASNAQVEPLHVGQMRDFKIVTIDRDTKQIALELTT
ncbi:30S ribosomal protein S1 [Edaphobacter modestus]|uniref:SSU ribosomal protein S1P n=1 Tax=Edaphobacter modestus TaxID=388466 RepID=A0A4Q7YP63_9BACT|nr:30S ribosomal protein S1 [Edaphobacter modestus]RZU39168.1 SSU ribosomal protein S1P [Edaphobacter modestus]